MRSFTACALFGGGEESNDALLAVGYANGMVRCFRASEGGPPLVALMGHKGVVTCLASGDGGMLLASGGNDTDLVLWDLVAERGLARLRGHRDAITAVRFVPTAPTHWSERSGHGAQGAQRG